MSRNLSGVRRRRKRKDPPLTSEVLLLHFRGRHHLKTKRYRLTGLSVYGRQPYGVTLSPSNVIYTVSTTGGTNTPLSARGKLVELTSDDLRPPLVPGVHYSCDRSQITSERSSQPCTYRKQSALLNYTHRKQSQGVCLRFIIRVPKTGLN